MSDEKNDEGQPDEGHGEWTSPADLRNTPDAPEAEAPKAPAKKAAASGKDKD